MWLCEWSTFRPFISLLGRRGSNPWATYAAPEEKHLLFVNSIYSETKFYCSLIIVIVNSNFLQCPQKRSSKLIRSRLTKTKFTGMQGVTIQRVRRAVSHTVTVA